jgi:hypothetical protein
MIVRSNAVGVAIEDVLNMLRTPAVLNLVPDGPVTSGDDLVVPGILVSYQDNQGGSITNLNGDELMTAVFLTIVSVTETGDMELADQIDRLVRKAILFSAGSPTRVNTKGEVYSCTFDSSRNYVGPGRNGSGSYLYYGGYYKLRIVGEEL